MPLRDQRPDLRFIPAENAACRHAADDQASPSPVPNPAPVIRISLPAFASEGLTLVMIGPVGLTETSIVAKPVAFNPSSLDTST